ncbi:MAG: hypothetical protein AB7F40_06495 [Victivallaceae bacterium]
MKPPSLRDSIIAALVLTMIGCYFTVDYWKAQKQKEDYRKVVEKIMSRTVPPENRNRPNGGSLAVVKDAKGRDVPILINPPLGIDPYYEEDEPEKPASVWKHVTLAVLLVTLAGGGLFLLLTRGNRNDKPGRF